jgi:hypothetical protein
MASPSADNRSPEQLSEEELRAYLAQLREAPVVDMLGQAYTMLGSWAEAKLGRRDARPLIDAMSGLVQGAGPGLPEDLAKRMRDGIAQLQMAQVQAEQQLAAQQARTAGQESAADQKAPQSSSSGAGQSTQRLTDRLWIPGRDPKPSS